MLRITIVCGSILLALTHQALFAGGMPRRLAEIAKGQVQPRTHIALRWSGATNFSPFVDGKRLVFSTSGGIMTRFKIDGNVVDPNRGGPLRLETVRKPIKPPPGKPGQLGWQTVMVYQKLRITQIVELVPTIPSKKGLKPRIDAVRVRYIVENKDKVPHDVGLRIALDTLLVNNDGCLWAAPTVPGKILNGVQLSGKEIPPYLKVLQRPDLKNPGYVAHWTFDLGRGREKPTRIVLTRHGNEYTVWDVVAARSFGDTGMAIFWDPRKIPAKSKVEFAYAYGEGIAHPPDGAGLVKLQAAEKAEAGTPFEVRAVVVDPSRGQWLRLVVPAGIDLVECDAYQAVPPVPPGQKSLVTWRCRASRPGNYTLRVLSSNDEHCAAGITVVRDSKRGR